MFSILIFVCLINRLLLKKYKSKEGDNMENCIDTQFMKLHQADACYLYEKKNNERNEKRKTCLL